MSKLRFAVLIFVEVRGWLGSEVYVQHVIKFTYMAEIGVPSITSSRSTNC